VNRLWLNSVCAKESGRDFLSSPMCFWHRDRIHTIATDGTRLVELPGVDGVAAPPEEILPGLRKYLAPTLKSSAQFDFAALRAFIIDTTRGTRSGQQVRAFIGGQLFNARLFLPMVKNLSTKNPARWYRLPPGSSFPSGPAGVDGGEWRFLVMPMLDKMSADARAGVPRFDIEGAQAAAA
jgi:hypothetical protein